MLFMLRGVTLWFCLCVHTCVYVRVCVCVCVVGGSSGSSYHTYLFICVFLWMRACVFNEGADGVCVSCRVACLSPHDIQGSLSQARGELHVPQNRSRGIAAAQSTRECVVFLDHVLAFSPTHW